MRVEQNLIDRAAAVPVARHLDGMRAFHLAHEPLPQIHPAQF
jgi:hypothetical protein